VVYRGKIFRVERKSPGWAEGYCIKKQNLVEVRLTTGYLATTPFQLKGKVVNHRGKTDRLSLKLEILITSKDLADCMSTGSLQISIIRSSPRQKTSDCSRRRRSFIVNVRRWVGVRTVSWKKKGVHMGVLPEGTEIGQRGEGLFRCAIILRIASPLFVGGKDRFKCGQLVRSLLLRRGLENGRQVGEGKGTCWRVQNIMGQV